MSVYPGDVDTFTTKADGPGHTIYAADINGLQDAIVAIQETLGVDPAGTAATVADRLSANQVITTIADTPLSAPRVVTFADSGSVRYLDATNVADVGRLPLVTMTAVSSPGDPVNLISAGPAPWPAGGLIPGTPLFLGAAGVLTVTQPTGLAFTQLIAYALEPSTIYVDPQSPILM